MIRLTATMAPTHDALSDLSLLVRSAAGGADEPTPAWVALELAIHEVAVNVIEHARPTSELTVAIDVREGVATIDLTDDGEGFDPRGVPVPDPSALPESGFGLHIARQLVDRLIYETRPSWNRWTLVKELDT